MRKKSTKNLINLIAIFYYLLTFLVVVNIAKAQDKSEDDIYLINNIAVDTEGKTPASARENAVSQARRNALVILLNRLSISENLADNISDQEIADMIHSEQITNEKISGNNYSANFNIAFSEEFVNYILNSKNISSKTEKAESYLIFPIKITDKGNLLWEKNNDWRLNWEKTLDKKSTNPSLKIVLPKGNLEDISIIDSEKADYASFDDFEPLLSKYKTDAAIIIYFEFDDIENKANIVLKTVRKFQKKQVKLSFVNIEHLDRSNLMLKVIEKINEYIKNNKSSSSEVSKVVLNINVAISNLEDWLDVKNKLENTNFIEQIKVNSISSNLVNLTIKYDGNNGDITDLMTAKKLKLRRKDNGDYYLDAHSSVANPFNY